MKANLSLLNWSVFGTLQVRLPIYYEGSHPNAANALKRKQNLFSSFVLPKWPDSGSLHAM